MGDEGNDFPLPGKLLPGSRENTSRFPGNEGKDIGKDCGKYGVGDEGRDG